jgi:glycerol-3-phosphate dehydrogenase
MAKLVVKILANCGLGLVPKKEFNPCRKGVPNFRELQNDQKEALIARDPRYAHIVCRCETVTEGEIVEAIRRGARTVDGIKFRTKAGMGRCQGGFCSPRVTQILARELGVPATEITKRGGNSRLLLFKSKEKLKNRGEGENQNEISRG